MSLVKPLPFSATSELHLAYLDTAQREWRPGDVVRLKNKQKVIVFETGEIMDVRPYNILTRVLFHVKAAYKRLRNKEVTRIGGASVAIGKTLGLYWSIPYPPRGQKAWVDKNKMREPDPLSS